LDGAVKPYRLLLPAFAPAVKAGLRPPREERASTRTSFREEPLRVATPALAEAAFPLLACPLRWAPLAEAEALPLCAFETPLAERAGRASPREGPWPLPFPFEWRPFIDPLAELDPLALDPLVKFNPFPECAPLCLPLPFPFGVQRAPEDPWRRPLAVRVSRLGRRAERLFEDDCAGLRSRV
jgi:hypothetical protein